MRRIILFELNEVPRRIFDEYVRWYPSSHLARKLTSSRRYDTLTADTGHLSPWVTWPTLHRGVDNTKHLLADFGQSTEAVDSEYPSIWRILANSGVRTGVGGSLFSYPLPPSLDAYDFYLPDTFAAGSECFPRALDSFQAFNLEMARASARNVSSAIPWEPALRFLAGIPGLGIRGRTLADVGRQLVEERMVPERKVRRRTYQSLLAFDVFMHQLERTRPAFSTFFTNHVASSMHRYWAATFPGDYDELGYDAGWIELYKNEVRFAMHKADALLSRVFDFVDRNPEYQLWIATSMGQGPIQSRPVETQMYPTEPARFMAGLGFEEGQWTRMPAMLPQFNVRIAPDRQQELSNRLTGMRVGPYRVPHRLADDGFVSMDLGHPNLEPDHRIVLDDKLFALAELGLSNVEIQDKSGTTAYHVPEGCLMIYDPKERREMRSALPISTLDIAPAILRNFGIEPPSYMQSASRLASD